MEEKEFSLDELDNVFGGISRETGIEKAQEHPELYRQNMKEIEKATRNFGQENKDIDIQKKIEELTRQRDAILSSKEYREAHANTQSGRSK